MKMFTPAEEQAQIFMRSIYEATAHGEDDHKQWLHDELMKWAKPLERLLKEAHQHGVESVK